MASELWLEQPSRSHYWRSLTLQTVEEVGNKSENGRCDNMDFDNVFSSYLTTKCSLVSTNFSRKTTAKSSREKFVGNRGLIQLLKQVVIEANIIGPMLHLLQHVEFDIKKEAACAISGESHEQIQYIVNHGHIKPLCDLLVLRDPRIAKVCLGGLENILKVGETDKELGEILVRGMNKILKMVGMAHHMNFDYGDNQSSLPPGGYKFG